MTSRAVRGWAVRLVVFGGVVAFLLGQVRWDDTLTLESGEVLSGRVEARPGGSFDVEGRRVGPEEVAPRRVGDRDVPAVAWGLRTLGGRLAGRPAVLALVLALVASTYLLTALRWHGLLAALDLTLPLRRCLRLNFVGAFFNQAVPGSTGGDVVKAWYAAVSTGRATRAVISVFADRLLGMVGLAIFAGGALALAPPGAGYGPAKAVVLGVLAATAVLAALVASPRLRRALGVSLLVPRLPFPAFFAEVGAAARLYRAHPVALGGALLLSLVNHAGNSLAVFLLARALGLEGVSLGATFALVPVANLFAGVPLVPGGWGVGELAFAWLFGQVGVPATEAIGLSVLYRLLVLAVSLPGGALWIFWPGRPTRASIARRVEEAAHEIEAREAAAEAAEEQEEDR